MLSSAGPYAVIDAHVEIGSGNVIGPHVIIHPYTRIGTDNQIHAHAVLGDIPQHEAFTPDIKSGLQIGNNNSIREMVTIHRALYEGENTRIGSNNLFMVNSHVAHDCIVGDHIIVTNCAGLGGHIEVGDYAIVGGLVGVHQFVRVGAYAMVAATSMIRKDVLPYSMIGGEPARHYRLNTIGLRRNGVSGDRYRELEKMFRALRAGNETSAGTTDETQFLYKWLQEPSKRGLSGFAKTKS